MNKQYRTNLELSRKLKELGMSQECDSYWYGITSGTCGQQVDEPNKWILTSIKMKFYQDQVASPCCGALGEMLPRCRTRDYKVNKWVNGKCLEAGWECHYEDPIEKKQLYVTESSETNARASMIIELCNKGICKFVDGKLITV